LVGAPIKQIGKNHAREKRPERRRIISRSDRVEFFGMLGSEDIEPSEKIAAAQSNQSEHRYNNPDDQ